ncbi:MAG: hypothetical protein ACU0B1_10565 [Thermohalobaculum sp.]
MSARVTLDGVDLGGAVDVSVTCDDRMSAGWFDVRATWTGGELPVGSRAVVEITDTETGDVFIEGRIDQVCVDIKRQSVNLRGRDFAADLIGATSTEAYENQSALDVVGTIAARHRLAAAVDLPALMIGRTFQASITRTIVNQYTRLQTDWEILCAIARRCGTGLRVSGRKLVMEDKQSVSATTRIDAGQLLECSVSWDMTIQDGGQVTVMSWDSAREQVVRTTLGTEGSGLYFGRPNLAADVVEGIAGGLRRELQGAGTRVRLTKAVDPSLAPGAKIALALEKSPMDGVYRVQSICRRFSARHGAVEEIHGCLDVWSS